jgi:phospholipid/cholesterol/gamma-HCH transport system ATP-binding protein
VTGGDRSSSPTPHVEWKGVRTAFAGKPVLRGLDLAVLRGEVMFIIGASGVGKSVAIKHLVGLLPIDAGEIWFDGARIDQLPERELAPLRKRLGMVFQSATLFDSMTLAENVALPLRKHGKLGHRAALEDPRSSGSPIASRSSTRASPTSSPPPRSCARPRIRSSSSS